MASKNRKVVQYRRPPKINIGLIIFAILFIYLCLTAYSYMGRKKVRYFEVESGQMVNDTGHTGMILRTEAVQNAPSTGYVNYYIRDGKRAGVGTRIYSLDETGTLKKFLDENADSSGNLSEQNLKELKNRLSSFAGSYHSVDFVKAYDSMDSIQAVLSEYTSLNMLDSLNGSLEQNGISFQQVTAPMAGVISFNVDSYEEMTPEQMTASVFDPESYKPSYIVPGNLAEAGKPVYKIIPSEDWRIVFPLSEEQHKEYEGKNSLRVFFKNDDLTIPGDYAEVTGADGALYGVLTFHQFMVRFVSDRYVNFQVASGNEDGLKIPRSSITKKAFFTVPADYKITGGNSVSSGFMKEVYQDGAVTAEFVPAEIFFENESFCYLDASGNGEFSTGDYLLKPDSEERFQIGATDTLEGVYNINKGYAVFKQIDIIEENDEYVTVRRGTSYGLNVYDHILLNGEEGEEGQPIYQ
ncbi:MAG: hypothetical protein IJT43_12400 [Stomatobaculum sp.]|nr:hypothetical protein [Stomatobaculum sp.]